MTAVWIGVGAALGGVISFVGIWCLAIALISRAGWSTLAKTFATGEAPPSSTRALRIAWVGRARYRGYAITAGSDRRGLFLRAASMFRLGHPPLLVPRELLSRGERAERRVKGQEVPAQEVVIRGSPVRLWLELGDADDLLGS